MKITEFRTKYPEYNHVADDDLAGRLHKKYYGHMVREDFDQRFLGRPSGDQLNKELSIGYNEDPEYREGDIGTGAQATIVKNLQDKQDIRQADKMLAKATLDDEIKEFNDKSIGYYEDFEQESGDGSVPGNALVGAEAGRRALNAELKKLVDSPGSATRVGTALDINAAEGFPMSSIGAFYYWQTSGQKELDSAKSTRSHVADLEKKINSQKYAKSMFWEGRMVPKDEVRKKLKGLRESARADELVGKKKRAEHVKKWAKFQKEYQKWESRGLAETVAAGVGALIGASAGPESAIGVTRGVTLWQTFRKGFMVNAGVNVLVDPITQYAAMRHGMQKEFSTAQTAMGAILGGGLGGIINVTPHFLSKIIQKARQRRPLAFKDGEVSAEETINAFMAMSDDDLTAAGLTPEEIKAVRDAGIEGDYVGDPAVKKAEDKAKDLDAKLYDSILEGTDTKAQRNAARRANDDLMDEVIKYLSRKKDLDPDEVAKLPAEQARDAPLSEAAKSDPSTVHARIEYEGGPEASTAAKQFEESVFKERPQRNNQKWYQDWSSRLLGTTYGRLRGLGARYGKAVQEYVDMFAPEYAGRAAVPDTIDVAIRRTSAKRHNQMARILEDARKTMTPEQIRMAVNANRGIINPKPGTKPYKLSKEFEAWFKQYADDADAAGLSFKERHFGFTRVYDDGVIRKNQVQASGDFHQAFGHTFLWEARLAEARSRGERLRDPPKNRHTDKMGNVIDEATLTTKQRGEIERRIRNGKKYLNKDGSINLKKIKSEAAEAADATVGDIVLGRTGSEYRPMFATGPSSSPIKERSLAPGIEQYVHKWMITDPERALFKYNNQMTRKIEWAKRMGPNNEVRHDLFKRMKDEGVPEDVRKKIAELSEATVGIGRELGTGYSISSWARMITTLGLLDKVSLTSISELAMPAVRAGKPHQALEGFAKGLYFTFKNIFREDIPGGRKWSVKDRFLEFMEYEGILREAMSDMSLSMKWAGDDMAEGIPQRATSKFMRMVGMSQMHQAMSSVAAGSMDRLIRAASKRVIDGDTITYSKARALDDLEELGVPKAHAEEFARFLLGDAPAPDRVGVPGLLMIEGGPKKLEGGQKKIEGEAGRMAEGPMKDLYVSAMDRGIHQTIQMPMQGQRPLWASSDVGSVVFHLQSFIWAFHNNVLRRNLFELPKKALTKKGYNAADRMALLLPAATMMALLPAIQYAMLPVRDAMYGRFGEDQEEWERWGSAISRAGLLGVFDVPLNIVTGDIKYGRSIAETATGPTFGRLLSAMEDTMKWFTDNSPNTNTADRRMAKWAFDLFIEPNINMAAGHLSKTGLFGFPYVGGMLRQRAIDKMAGPYKDKDKLY